MGKKWWLQTATGSSSGPFTTAALVRSVRSGRLSRTILARDGCDGTWTPVESIREFADALRARSGSDSNGGLARREKPRLRVFRTRRTEDDEDDEGPRNWSFAYAFALTTTALLMAVHLAISLLIGFALVRGGTALGNHFAFDAAGSFATFVFYAWATFGFWARRLSAYTWAMRVNVALAALAVVTFAEGCSQTDHWLRELRRWDVVAWVRLGYPATMIVLFLIAALFTFAARDDLDES